MRKKKKKRRPVNPLRERLQKNYKKPTKKRKAEDSPKVNIIVTGYLNIICQSTKKGKKGEEKKEGNIKVRPLLVIVASGREMKVALVVKCEANSTLYRTLYIWDLVKNFEEIVQFILFLMDVDLTSILVPGFVKFIN